MTATFKALATLLMVLAVGCSTTIRSVNCEEPTADPDTPAAAGCLYSDERVYNEDSSRPPALGLALSGGGMRAASYSMGVLKALNEREELDRVDVVSAVSGGAYTAGWFFAQRSSPSQPSSDDLFNDDCPKTGSGRIVNTSSGDPCRYQRHLERHSQIVTLPKTAVFAVADILAIPANILANGLFGWHANTTPHRAAYERALHREFFVEPGGSSVNIPMRDIRRVTKHGRLPLLVINTTAAIDNDTSHPMASLKNSIFEFTPVRYGSDAFGFRDSPYVSTLRHQVAVSGAALDFSTLTAGNAQKILLSALNLDLGTYRDNYNVVARTPRGATAPSCDVCDSSMKSRARFWRIRILHNLLPFPFYFAHHYKRDASGLRIYLSDGGHSENLGAFGLIRRMCSNIIIVDAEQDPQFRFGAYTKLRRAVAAELNGVLHIPAIDRHLRREERFDGSRPIMVGTASLRTSAGQDVELKIIYMKLSIDSGNLNRYSQRPNIQAYYEAKHWLRRLWGTFPFQSTANQAYTAKRYRAYRDLGYLTIMSDPRAPQAIWEWVDSN